MDNKMVVERVGLMTMNWVVQKVDNMSDCRAERMDMTRVAS